MTKPSPPASKMPHSDTGVTLIGAGTVPDGRLAQALALAPVLWAVDGGADTAMAQGYMPCGIMGDLDSVTAQTRAQLPHVPTPDQDYPDFDKALTLTQAPLIVALGMTGSRLDHTLAGLSALLRHPLQRVILDAGDDIACLVPPTLTLTLPRRTRLSLYPMQPLGCQSSGLRYGTDGLVLDPFGRIGTSNETRDASVTLAPEGPGMILILPQGQMPALAKALRAAPLWPRPAHAQ